MANDKGSYECDSDIEVCGPLVYTDRKQIAGALLDITSALIGRPQQCHNSLCQLEVSLNLVVTHAIKKRSI